MSGWDGKKTEPMALRTVVCGGCGKQHRDGVGATLVKQDDYIHNSPSCRQQLLAKRK